MNPTLDSGDTTECGCNVWWTWFFTVKLEQRFFNANALIQDICLCNVHIDTKTNTHTRQTYTPTHVKQFETNIWKYEKQTFALQRQPRGWKRSEEKQNKTHTHTTSTIGTKIIKWNITNYRNRNQQFEWIIIIIKFEWINKTLNGNIVDVQNNCAHLGCL